MTRPITPLRPLLALGLLLFVASQLPSCATRGDRSGASRPALPIVAGYATVRVDGGGPVPAEVVAVAFDTVSYSGETLVVYGKAIFTEKEVARAATPDGNPRLTEFWLDAHGTAALRAFSADVSAGQQRMALRLGPRWVAFPVITSTISDGRFPMFDLTAAERDTVAAAFGAGK